MKKQCKTCMGSCDPLRHVAWILVIIGALNWGLVGIFQWDLVGGIFGPGSIVARIIFILVAASALYLLFACCGKGKKMCCDGTCESEKDSGQRHAESVQENMMSRDSDSEQDDMMM